jgi:hypothetical protein
VNKQNWALAVFLLVLVGSVGHALYYYEQIPERTAAVVGTPLETWNKLHWLVVHLRAIAIVAVLFLGLGFGARWMPEWAFSFDTGYWLAPERREETLASLCQYMLWFGTATIVLLADMFHQPAQVHLGKAEGLGHFWISVGVYVLFFGVGLFRLLARFNFGFRPVA